MNILLESLGLIKILASYMQVHSQDPYASIGVLRLCAACVHVQKTEFTYVPGRPKKLRGFACFGPAVLLRVKHKKHACI